MIKIATITTHGALNYGAVLQAYALSTYLNGAGYHCEILDYRPNYVKESYRLIKAPHSPSGVLLAGFQALHYQERKTRKQRFEQFQKEYLRTTYEKATQREELTALANEFDLLICGSDQIWNPKLHHFDEAYFLSYPEITVKRMAYAASFGQDSLDDDSKKEIARRIARIERFGCREFSAKKIVEELSGRDAEIVLDPVFLLSAETWRSVKKAFDHRDENYILGYFLSNPGHSIKAACSYAHSAGRKLYSIGFSPRDVGNDAVNCYDLGPQEFLSAVDDAEMVVTNSFHATAFSIIFHNWVLKNNGKFDKVAQAVSEKSGIVMEVWTDLPGMQMYTANFLDNEHGKNGAVYGIRDAVCFETQYFPDAVHHENFASPICKKGMPYHTVTSYKFETK